mmetsp:Transcript_10362/g.29142  ORF Transcript_10362/g.29142 Transcript_10362/m.29142 type:complete len:418 (+) Transcript_10362:277-1530(+)
MFTAVWSFRIYLVSSGGRPVVRALGSGMTRRAGRGAAFLGAAEAELGHVAPSAAAVEAVGRVGPAEGVLVLLVGGAFTEEGSLHLGALSLENATHHVVLPCRQPIHLGLLLGNGGDHPLPDGLGGGHVLIELAQYRLNAVALGHGPFQEALQHVVALGQLVALGLQAAVGGDEVVDGGAEDVLPVFSRLLLLLGNTAFDGIGGIGALAEGLEDVLGNRAPLTRLVGVLLGLDLAHGRHGLEGLGEVLHLLGEDGLPGGTVLELLDEGGDPGGLFLEGGDLRQLILQAGLVLILEGNNVGLVLRRRFEQDLGPLTGHGNGGVAGEELGPRLLGAVAPHGAREGFPSLAILDGNGGGIGVQDLVEDLVGCIVPECQVGRRHALIVAAPAGAGIRPDERLDDGQRAAEDDGGVEGEEAPP